MLSYDFTHSQQKQPAKSYKQQQKEKKHEKLKSLLKHFCKWQWSSDYLTGLALGEQQNKQTLNPDRIKQMEYIC